MNDNTSTFAKPLTHDLLVSLLLLTVASVGGWAAYHLMDARSSSSVHLRLLMVLLIHPFALAAWVFCGLPGLGLAMKSLFGAIEQRKALAGIASVGLLALSLACACFWI